MNDFDVDKAGTLLKYLAMAYSSSADFRKRQFKNELVKDFLNIKRLLFQAKREGAEPDKLLPLIDRAEKIKKRIKNF